MSSPLINLCNPAFKTVVSCDTISSEGYEVTNLLSEDCQKRKNGFLSDRFIKPPVEITLKFPFDVNLKYIQIGAVVGQQKSSGLELYSSSVPYNSSMCSGSPAPNNQNKHGLICSPTIERIASVVLNDNERGVVIFCPLQYGRKNPNPVANVDLGFIQRSMMWKKRSVIAHTSSLTLRIFKTCGSAVPAIGSLEIWGSPSSCMPANKLSGILNLWKSSQEKLDSNETEGAAIEHVPYIPEAPSKKVNETVIGDIPEEFFDAITWEIMALPMVLPSGKVVDQQTLDLHAQAEANWGRHPGDPFTGIMFSEGCRPVLDTALKARIDRFLVLNQDRKDLKTIPRTVGRVQPKVCHQTVSRFRNNRVCFGSSASRKHSITSSSTTLNSQGATQGRSLISLPVSMPGCSTHPQPNEPEDKLESAQKKPKLSDVSSSSFPQNNISTIDLTLDDSNHLDDLKSHEKKLDDSLDSALKAVLSGLPSFVNPCSTTEIVKECASCKLTESLYSLPCSHFLCRPCLVNESKQKQAACPSCQIEFKSSDPVFHHD
ncbi:RING finger protein 37 [Frankliniella fusca]|uniref:RING finger protein 37 n=1 Tax=Frankliniella fusca TaxID=407009 RepID=A0AAE1LAN2_9NEOP|nr:RING finger protein 37 [Frankliniella fusca]